MTDANTTLQPPASTGSWAQPSGMGHAIVIGSVVGTVISFISVSLLLHLADVEWGSAIGLGAFIGFWGGLGFGSMVAGVVWASSSEVAAHSTGAH